MLKYNKFDLTNKVILVTGGGGFLARQHANVVLKNNGKLILIDINKKKLISFVKELGKKYQKKVTYYLGDITKENFLIRVLENIKKKFGKIDVLINNAAIDYSPKNNKLNNSLKLENFSIKIWNQDISAGLTGALLCSKVFGAFMCNNKKGGVILNIASDLGLIAPDHRIYKKSNKDLKSDFVKPVSYSVVKHGIIGLTKYIATYWAKYNLRCNALAPGGIYNNQDKRFVKKVSKLIPLGRLAFQGEYEQAILFLISDASSYMNGSVMVVDGGRTAW
jgi:NAD(P)-dependent dehydrogenase (short-subunit alcohol dehydrogenase family)